MLIYAEVFPLSKNSSFEKLSAGNISSYISSIIVPPVSENPLCI